MMRTPTCSVTPLASNGFSRSECVYRSLTLVAMLLVLATLWAF
jgi:hypothetical protein